MEIKNLGKFRFEWWVLGFSILYFFLFAIKSFHSDPIGPDGVRQLVTGVFYRDLLFSLPVENLKDFAFQYYLYYPCLGVLHWPPVFHLMEAVLFTIFGIHEEIPRILIWVLTICGGYFSGKITQQFGGKAFEAFLTFVAFCSFPIVFSFSQQYMLEIPAVSISVVSLYFFIRYLKENVVQFVYLAAFFAVVSMLTKGTTVYLIPLFTILAWVSRGNRMFRDIHLYFSAFGFALVMGTYNFLVSKFNGVRATELFGYYEWNYIFAYCSFVWKNVGWLALFFWFYSLILSRLKRQVLLFWFLFCWCWHCHEFGHSSEFSAGTLFDKPDSVRCDRSGHVSRPYRNPVAKIRPCW